jgi:hypothetical protein
MQFDESEAQCPHCGEAISVPLDPSQGMTQHFIEDCPVCCRAISMRVTWDQESGEAIVSVGSD